MDSYLLFARRNRFWRWGHSLAREWMWMRKILITLTVPAIPTISVSTAVIAEAPVSQTIELSVPAVPSIAVSTAVATFSDAGTCTMTIASPCVVTKAAHGLAANHEIFFNTTGALPTGIVRYTHYYVKDPLENTYNVSATPGGAAINTSGSQSGTHSLWTKD